LFCRKQGFEAFFNVSAERLLQTAVAKSISIKSKKRIINTFRMSKKTGFGFFHPLSIKL